MSQVPADVKQGIDLLLNQLLPTVVTKIRTLEAEVAALKSELETLKAAPAPAPKRKRTTKKGNPDGSVVEKPSKDGKVDFAISPEQDAAIRELYQQTVGVPLENMEILTDADGNNLTVNFAPVTVEVVDEIKKVMNENPAATPQDVSLATKQPAIVVCFVIVMFGL